jgi:hypothetical protein
MHDELESKLIRIKVDRGLHVVDDVAHLHGCHVLFSSELSRAGRSTQKPQRTQRTIWRCVFTEFCVDRRLFQSFDHGSPAQTPGYRQSNCQPNRGDIEKDPY